MREDQMKAQEKQLKQAMLNWADSFLELPEFDSLMMSPASMFRFHRQICKTIEECFARWNPNTEPEFEQEDPESPDYNPNSPYYDPRFDPSNSLFNPHSGPHK